MTIGACSGTLIAPDLVATAGHCAPATAPCTDKRIVFNATNVNMRDGDAIPADTLYSCAEVVAREFSGGQDWAVIRLDREVPATVATPVVVGTNEMPPGTGLMMIGHPNSLPRKYADEATVGVVASSGDARLKYYTDLDAFGGSSGSGVFTTGFTDDATGTCYPAGLLVGITVTRSGTDYNTDDGCPTTYPQGTNYVGVSGALNLVPHASSTDAGTTPCPPPPPGTTPDTTPGTTASATTSPTTSDTTVSPTTSPTNVAQPTVSPTTSRTTVGQPTVSPATSPTTVPTSPSTTPQTTVSPTGLAPTPSSPPASPSATPPTSLPTALPSAPAACYCPGCGVNVLANAGFETPVNTTCSSGEGCWQYVSSTDQNIVPAFEQSYEEPTMVARLTRETASFIHQHFDSPVGATEVTVSGLLWNSVNDAGHDSGTLWSQRLWFEEKTACLACSASNWTRWNKVV